MVKKRKRFDVTVLERYEFVDYIIDYLRKVSELNVISSKVDKHIRFMKAETNEKKEMISAAVIGYGGSGKDLRDLPTPLQTELLPLVFRHWHKVSGGDKKVPLVILGHSFDEVFLRKIRLLNVAIPDLRLIQFINVYRFNSINDRVNAIKGHYKNSLMKDKKIKNEVNDLQSAVVEYLKAGGKLGGQSNHVLDCEVPAGEGTIKSEVIDILALEKKRRWLTVIELKFEKLTNVRLQSGIFQGLDYCNWVEDHKRGLNMLFPKHKIDTRRRTRFIIINGPEKFPQFHKDFAKSCVKKDRYQEIELYYTNSVIPLRVSLFDKTKSV